MSDHFQFDPIGNKSWADIVEEEEEYNRLHPDEQDDDYSSPNLETTPKVEETKAVEQEKEKVVLTGSRASKWATAPSDSPKKTPSHEKSTSIYTNTNVNGSSASKWSKAPASTITVPKRNYNKEFDSQDRNGGFDNKDNFKHLFIKKSIPTEDKVLPEIIAIEDKPLPEIQSTDIEEKPLPEIQSVVIEEEIIVKDEPPIVYTWGSLEEKEEPPTVAQPTLTHQSATTLPTLTQPITNSQTFTTNQPMTNTQSSIQPIIPAIPVVANEHEATTFAAKQVKKDDWKASMIQNDNISSWKSFVETNEIQAPTIIEINQVEERKEEVPAKQEERKQQSNSPLPTRNISFSFNELNGELKNISKNETKQISIRLSDLSQEPKQISINLSDLIGSEEENLKKKPMQNIFLNLNEFQ